jgi:hypothetical protein
MAVVLYHHIKIGRVGSKISGVRTWRWPPSSRAYFGQKRLNFTGSISAYLGPGNIVKDCVESPYRCGKLCWEFMHRPGSMISGWR